MTTAAKSRKREYLAMMSVIQRKRSAMELKSFKYLLLRFFPSTIAILFALITAVAVPHRATALVGQKSFSSPQLAVAALVEAVQHNNEAELLSILGPDSKDLIASGDRVADQNSRTRFTQAYEQKNDLEQVNEAQMTLLIGDKNYPFPIPIIRQGDTWVFDTPAGIEEILNRRIGRNELRTIEVMQAYTDAQREYACKIRNNGVPAFAQKLASSEGSKDGLYWDAGEGDEESPLGPLIARASKKGYTEGLDEDSAEPFQGYFFKILKAQSEHAAGGAFDYVVAGKMVLGFALIAYPAQYGASGIMTFIINQEGVIYEKDLGADTSMLAGAITSFDPDDSWRKHLEPAGQ